jgi:hypothetical protein
VGREGILDFGLAILDWGLGKERPAVSARGYSGDGPAGNR